MGPVRYATAHDQLNLTDDELRFVAKYSGQVRDKPTNNPQQATLPGVPLTCIWI